MVTDIDEAFDFTDIQVSSYNPTDGPRDLVIGLDFGTSMTKVVIGDHGTREGKMYAIPFKNNSYLQPTSLFLKEGIFNLYEGERTSELKYTLMTDPDKVIGSVTAYIALILRYVRYYFLKKYENIYKRSELIWAINIGVPSTSFDNQALCDAFRLVALAGWYASVQEGHIDTQKIETALETSRRDLKNEKRGSYYCEDGKLDINLVHVVPEVIAEVIGYTKSSLRNEGMHLLVDIGATTTDIATLNICKKDGKKDGKDIYPLFWVDVKYLGAFELHKSRIEQISKQIKPDNEERFSKFKNGIDELSPIPDLEQYRTICSHVNDKNFMGKFKSQVHTVVEETKKSRNSTGWETGLPVFVCGGGSRLKLYEEAIREEYDEWRKHKIVFVDTGKKVTPCRLVELPKPSNLEADELPTSEFHRLAVAYGLSFPFDEKTFIPPSQIEDINPQNKPDVTPSQGCPNCDAKEGCYCR